MIQIRGLISFFGLAIVLDLAGYLGFYLRDSSPYILGFRKRRDFETLLEDEGYCGEIYGLDLGSMKRRRTKKMKLNLVVPK